LNTIIRSRPNSGVAKIWCEGGGTKVHEIFVACNYNNAK